MKDGSDEKVGIKYALLKADEIKAIFDPSPPVQVSLHRLLLTVLHCVFGPEDLNKWKQLWSAGSWDNDALSDYLDSHYDSFDLFSSSKPFYQAAGLLTKNDDPKKGYEAVSVSKLMPEASSGNNPTLFDHTLDDSDLCLNPDQAARLVVSCQNYNLGGLVSRIPGEPSSAMAAPLVRGAVVLFRGNNLFKTLMYNLVVYDPEKGKPFHGIKGKQDLPAWERTAPSSSVSREPEGYLDYLTWQSMRIKLLPVTDNGTVNISRTILAAGTQSKERPPDPHFAYKKNVKAKANEDPWNPLRFREDRAIWRDSTTLFAAGLEHHKNPETCNQLARLIEDGFIERIARYELNVAGLCSNKAKISFWRNEHLPVPVDYFLNPDLSDYLLAAIDLAEYFRWVLLTCLQQLPNQGRGENESPGKVKPSETVNSTALQYFWSRLEQPFYKMLSELPKDQESSLEKWGEHLLRKALASFDHAAGCYSNNGLNLRFIFAARNNLERRLAGKLKSEGVKG